MSIRKEISKKVVISEVKLDPWSYEVIRTYLDVDYMNTAQLLCSHILDEFRVFNDMARIIDVYFDNSFGSFYKWVVPNEVLPANGHFIRLSKSVVDESLTSYAKLNGLLEPVQMIDNMKSLDHERNIGKYTFVV